MVCWFRCPFAQKTPIQQDVTPILQIIVSQITHMGSLAYPLPKKEDTLKGAKDFQISFPRKHMSESDYKLKKAKRQASYCKIIIILMKNLTNSFHIITCHNIMFPWSIFL